MGCGCVGDEGDGKVQPSGTGLRQCAEKIMRYPERRGPIGLL